MIALLNPGPAFPWPLDVRIDPLPPVYTIGDTGTLVAHSRCRHEMVADWCAACRGVGASLELLDDPDDDDTATPKWIRTETFGDCSACGHPVPLGGRAAWSPTHGGMVGDCCEAAL